MSQGDRPTSIESTVIAARRSTISRSAYAGEHTEYAAQTATERGIFVEACRP
jgi:hypothetical protein